MKTKNTIILLLAATALLAFIALWEKKQPSTREAQEQARHVVNFDRDDIDGISIVNNETRIELRKRDNQWRMEAPVKDLADSAAADSILSGAELLKKEETLDKSEKDSAQRVKDFGLAQPNTRLKLLGRKAPPELLFGKDSALQGKIYMRLEGSDTIYVTGNELKNQVTKSADEFRDHRLTDLSVQQVEKCVIKSDSGEIELQKTGAHWEIKKPIKARGDDARIADLIAQTLTTRIDKFIPDTNPNANIYGLADSKRTLSFFEQGKDKPNILQFGVVVDKEPDKVYAKLSTRDSVFTLPKSVQDALSTKPNDLRDRNLVRFDLDIVDRIKIEPEGKPKIVLGRKEENWTLKSAADKPANKAAVTVMVNTMQRQQVATFVADVASDLAKYGLDRPRLKVTFSSYASENTAETQAGENEIVKVAFGNSEGDNIYARLESEPFIVSVNKSILDSIPLDPVQWQELTIFKFKPEELTTLSITKETQSPLSFTRDAKAGWTLASGTGVVDQVNIQSLCNTLSSLRAVRWVGQDTTGTGLDKPSLSLSFALADKKSFKLTVGSEANGVWYATTDNSTGTFCISRPDHEALLLPLLQTAQPSPAAPAVSPAPTAAK